MTELPEFGSMVIHASEWKEGERPGELVRALVDDPAGYRTMLMKIAPGPLGVRHAHDEIEQIYVMEGDFFDEEGSYQAGDFVLRMPGTMHRAGSKKGCTMMVVYTPLAGAQA